MKVRSGLACVLALVGTAGAVTTAAQAKVKFTRMGNIAGTGGVVDAFTRTSDGRLHLMFPTAAGGAQGLSTRATNLSGVFGPTKPALGQTWGVSAPGLAHFPNGTLAAFYGAVAPIAPFPGGTWEITSSDGGASWSTPLLVSSTSSIDSQAYGAAVTAQISGGAPVLTLNVAGHLVVQYGLGSQALVQRVDTPVDGSPVAVDSTVDGANGQVVAAWDSLAAGTGGLYLRTIWPSLGTPEKLPGRSRPQVTVAGRDTGPGVFAAYTTDNRHVRLLRYGAGTVAVGSAPPVRPATLGVATGIDGRIWVMWGSDDGQLAITRSNRAVTRFEPIQHVTTKLDTLDRLSGDGRRGPLNLLVDELPAHGSTGLYEAKILPVLTAGVSVTAVKNPHHQVTGHKLTVTVTDAGDAVKGATVEVKGVSKKTNVHGVATFSLAGAAAEHVGVTVKDDGYQALHRMITLG
jgi:hypothetical protein